MNGGHTANCPHITRVGDWIYTQTTNTPFNRYKIIESFNSNSNLYSRISLSNDFSHFIFCLKNTVFVINIVYVLLTKLLCSIKQFFFNEFEFLSISANYLMLRHLILLFYDLSCNKKSPFYWQRFTQEKFCITRETYYWSRNFYLH